MFFKQQTPLNVFHSRNVAPICCGLILLVSMMLAACGGTTTTTGSTPTAKAKISVLYAGSLVNLMEKKVGPAFTQATGYPFEGEGKGSTALAAEIKGHLRTPDIFISASAAVDKSLMGSAGGNYVSWYATFTRTSMVIGYNPQSKFAADFQAAANGTKTWYSVLEEPGMRIGRTDPALDPKGVSTIILMELAEKYYNQPGLTQKILGSPSSNTSQIFPEETLAARLGAGQLDAGFFYLNEVKDLNLPYITLPTQINLSDPSLNTTYATASYTDPKAGKKVGAAIAYTITIPSTSKNSAGAIAFANFLLSSQGQAILMSDGLLQTTFKLYGDTSAVPAQLQQYFH